MKLDEKRRVVEVLLCRGNDDQFMISEVCSRLNVSRHVGSWANAAWQSACDFHGWTTSASDDALEAAYRLIESSPTLRREFFGVSP